jgi:hypothetical protein
VRWNEIYRYLSSYDDFRKLVQNYIAIVNEPREEKNKFFEWLKQRSIVPEYTEMLINLENKQEWRGLVNFLTDWKDVIFKITNWEIYRRVTESTSEIPANIDNK